MATLPLKVSRRCTRNSVLLFVFSEQKVLAPTPLTQKCVRRTVIVLFNQQYTFVKNKRYCLTFKKSAWGTCSLLSFQLGTVTLAGCPVGKSCLTVCPRRQSAQREMLYVLTMYPAESWAPRVRAHEFYSAKRSVILSVCLSHSWTVSTWFDLRSWFLHHMVAPLFKFLRISRSSQNSKEITPSEGVEWGWGGYELAIFDQ